MASVDPSNSICEPRAVDAIAESFRRDDPGEFSQPPKSQHLPFDRQSSPLIVVEQKPFLADDVPQNLILSPQIFDRFLLIAVDSPGQSDQQELPRMQDEIHRNVLSERRPQFAKHPQAPSQSLLPIRPI